MISDRDNLVEKSMRRLNESRLENILTLEDFSANQPDYKSGHKSPSTTHRHKTIEMSQRASSKSPQSQANAQGAQVSDFRMSWKSKMFEKSNAIQPERSSYKHDNISNNSPSLIPGIDQEMFTPGDHPFKMRHGRKNHQQTATQFAKGPIQLSHWQRLRSKTFKQLFLIILDHKIFTYVMTTLTIYALFGDDCRLLLFTKPADSVFNVITIVAMAAFILEIVMSSIAKREEYLFSFYFWLDLISTLSLLFDISWLWDKLTGVDDIEASSMTQLMRAGRGARVGTKAGRIVRIVRILRLVRIMKLYKHSKAAMNNEDESMKNL